ncbi:MAG TPA: hypothetical protein VLZ28_04400 [Daejeonella sp.]|nr:hypothetical protein [Daejeonella sp.]
MNKIGKRQVLTAVSILFAGLCSLLLYILMNAKVIAELTVTNSTLRRIDSLSIEPNGNLTGKYIKVGPNETVEYKADMTRSAKTDGSYQLSYKLNNSTLQRRFGYYSNGYPAGGVTKIDIQSDTVIFTFSADNSYSLL